jgi:hypothetical protein
MHPTERNTAAGPAQMDYYTVKITKLEEGRFGVQVSPLFVAKVKGTMRSDWKSVEHDLALYGQFPQSAIDECRRMIERMGVYGLSESDAEALSTDRN